MSMSDDDESSSPVSDGPDPPVKKARYVWQIKGQYRLRQDDSNGRCSNDIEDDLFRLERNAITFRWQNEQIAKAVFDNAVNSVIENTSDIQGEMESLMDIYFNNNSGNLEDEAVRMAIRSHGLQKPCSCPGESHIKPLPNNIPFHQRSFFAQDGPSTSSQLHITAGGELENDILSEAVAVAIQKKGLGASSKSNNLRFQF
ncbi:hypothetical protein O3M35_007566 [Rhynocoris fuscipes]|uniref:Uncharacterized protein n=1 Tax=Rhynocoris fuscipes TaxID=488301 RepID=A0AAW1DFL5_9HEMI